MNYEIPIAAPIQPIDLSRQADFSLGVLRVFPSRCEIEAGARREYVQPRVMQVLTALAQADGAVVSRDALIDSCWEGRIVGDDAINRCIVKIRKIVAQDANTAISVETVARVGYRLIVGTAFDGGSRPSAKSPVSHARLIPAYWWIGSAGFAFLAGILIWLLWPRQKWSVTASRAFISTLAIEQQPALSPSGAMIAYAAGTETAHKIFVRGVTAGDPAKIVSDSYDDISPTWASDGVRLAYVAAHDNEPCRIMVVTIPAGQPHEAGRCRVSQRTSLSWQPRSDFVYFAEKNGLGYAIFRLDVQTGERQHVAESTWFSVPEPQVSPDGKWLTYIANWRFAQNSVNAYNLSTGEQKILGLVAASDFAGWSEDSKSVLVTITNGVSSEIWAYPINGHAPYRVYTAAADLRRLAAAPGGLLAVEANVDRMNLARASTSARTDPDIIDATNGQTWSPNFAPDGTLAFISNRSGEDAIWTVRPGEQPAQLFGAAPASLNRVRWSPDGTKLAFVVATSGNPSIKILTAQGAIVSSFETLSVGFGMPTWTPDGRALMVFDRKLLHAVRVDLQHPAKRAWITAQYWNGIAVYKGATYAIKADKPGLWEIDKGIRLISSKYPAGRGPGIVFRGDDVLVPDFDTGGPPRILAQPLAGGTPSVLAYAPGMTGESDFAADPRSGDIIYTANVTRDTNIDLLTLSKH
jgi:Tol biopolymer transport system component/DNA-binding winged helix-turn-helix (wHTH) protein